MALRDQYELGKSKNSNRAYQQALFLSDEMKYRHGVVQERYKRANVKLRTDLSRLWEETGDEKYDNAVKEFDQNQGRPTSAILAVAYGEDPDAMGEWFNSAGLDATLLADYAPDGEQMSDHKQFGAVSFDPESNSFSPRLHSWDTENQQVLDVPFTRGGKKFAQGGEVSDKFEAADIDYMLAVQADRYGEGDAWISYLQDQVGTIGGSGTPSTFDKIKNPMQNNNFLGMGREQKEQVLAEQQRTLIDEIAAGLGELSPGDIVGGDRDRMTLSGVGLKTDGEVTSGYSNVVSAIKANFPTMPSESSQNYRTLIRPTTGTATDLKMETAAIGIINSNPRLQGYVHHAGHEFGMSTSQRDDLPVAVANQYEIDSKALAMGAQKHYYEKSIVNGDIGQLQKEIKKGKNIPNKPITFVDDNGKLISEVYTEEQQAIISDFWKFGGSLKDKQTRLSTSPFYTEELRTIGPAAFAIKYADDSEWMKLDQQTSKESASLRRTIAQHKTFLKKKYDLDFPKVGPDGTIPNSEFEAFATKYDEIKKSLTDGDSEVFDDLDRKMAEWATMSIDRNTQTLDLNWIPSQSARHGFAGMMLAYLPQDQRLQAIDNFSRIAAYGQGSAVIATEERSNMQESQAMTSQAALMRAGGAAVSLNEGFTADMGAINDTAAGFLAENPEMKGSGRTATSLYGSDNLMQAITTHAAAMMEAMQLDGTVGRSSGVISMGSNFTQWDNTLEVLTKAAAVDAVKIASDNQNIIAQWFTRGQTAQAGTLNPGVKAYFKDPQTNEMMLLTDIAQLGEDRSGRPDFKKVQYIEKEGPMGNQEGADVAWSWFVQRYGNSISGKIIEQAIRNAR